MGQQAPQNIRDYWHNTIAEIQNMIQTEREQDEEKGEVNNKSSSTHSFSDRAIKQQYLVKDCLACTTSDNTDPDVIIIHTQRLYDTPRDLGLQTKPGKPMHVKKSL
jgi:hypothetical protein